MTAPHRSRESVHPGYYWAFSTARFFPQPFGGDGQFGIREQADWDLSHLCDACGAGAVRTSPLRLPARTLAKCEWNANIDEMVSFPPISERLVDRIAPVLPGPLPLQEIEQVGSGRRKERWFLLDPKLIVPESALEFAAYIKRPCGKCGAFHIEPIEGYLENPDPYRPSPIYIDPAWWASNPALAVLTPDWRGEAFRTTRILSVCYRQIWVRHEVVEAFRSVPRLRMVFGQAVWLADDPQKPPVIRD